MKCGTAQIIVATGLPERRKQPERYAPPKLVDKIKTIKYHKNYGNR
jgi:hypothetical protein